MTGNCPRCGPTVLRRVHPLLDGTPVSMCVLCNLIDTDERWRERSRND